MAYIDDTFYQETFNGTAIPDAEFDRLAEAASDVIDSIALVPIVEADLSEAALVYLKKATAYEVEMLYTQGGLDAIIGMPMSNAAGETLGGHQIMLGRTVGAPHPTIDGIPVSKMAISMLKKAGLMRRLIAEDLE